MTHNLNQGVKNYRSVSFHVKENKENCLKTTKLQGHVQPAQDDCYFMRHFPLLFSFLSRICNILFRYKLTSQLCFLVFIQSQPLTLLWDILQQSQETLRNEGPTAYLQKGTEPGAKSPFQSFKHWHARRIALTPFCITHAIALRNLRKPRHEITLLTWSKRKSLFCPF